ncbi:MAG TPA: YbhB/YbcL family Raf kinase inhibitor-like protein [Acidobacteriota bacterium]|nr:YbhB/YbcL family Raf kinase inhibitor-like protein [Acidobacteriota bacterium]HNT17538.1 YbhB/YbcL family Raf kinase inhibitor-like protein [Acidobacteriota bacterium]HPA26866.1 YbhB/YbcL family Raf kinase inhibitor-like protein [Acidobacteriota bacterium]HQO19864.1 YbhB/YbcL family Raf kinase inhibitor-like protein [Acidobacteriota bacterium]HQQ47279.1 YbhB/YbcL family Raf kinase inhibitor-like protein [Acidobacteriota bacterium]
MRSLIFLAFLACTLAVLSRSGKMTLKSAGFMNGETIPKVYSCEGVDLSPELEWTGFPTGTKSFALICDDPDAPMGTWVHWVIYNIPVDCTSLPRGVQKKARLENGSLQGLNSWPKTGYNGPCPPPGKPHRYFFRLYALDSVLDLKENATKEELLKAVKGRILAEAELMGTYRR